MYDTLKLILVLSLISSPYLFSLGTKTPLILLETCVVPNKLDFFSGTDWKFMHASYLSLVTYLLEMYSPLFLSLERSGNMLISYTLNPTPTSSLHMI